MTARARRYSVAVVVALCGVLLVIGFLNKDRCAGPRYDADGQSVPSVASRQFRDVCYSDVQYLWAARGLGEHRFPYTSAGGLSADGQLYGGAVEYPVLTGLLIWAGAAPADNEGQFLLFTAVLLAPFGLFTAWALGRMTRWRALVWSLGPPLVLYALHNWDLAVVALATAGFSVLYRGWGAAGAARPLRQRALVAAVCFGVGFAFKLYPALFVVPLMVHVATRGRDRHDVAGAVRVGAAALGTAVLVNLPFAVFGFDGWLASWAFQLQRTVDVTTNSVWFWGLRPFSDPDDESVQQLIGVASPVAVLLGCALAVWLGWRRYRRDGTYPVLGVSAAMLCAFLLLHKVHSPQYTLWLVPFFVLLRVRAGWIVAYYLADLAMGIGVFRWYYDIDAGIYDGFAAQAVVIGVWGRAALLVGLFVAFLAARPAVTGPPNVPARAAAAAAPVPGAAP